MKKGIDPFL